MYKKILKENDEFQLIKAIIANRKKRSKYGKVLVSGVKNINTVLQNKHEIENVYIISEKLSNWAKDVVKAAKIKAVISRALAQKLIEKSDLPELFILVKTPRYDFYDIEISNDFLFLVIDRSSNKGNLGTIIRSANSFAVDGLLLFGHGVDPWEQDVILSSIGTVFSMPIIMNKSFEELENWVASIKNRFPGLQVVGSSSKSENYIFKTDFHKPTILIVGNETHGMNKDLKGLSDEITKIPIAGDASSLNVACATSIYLYEISAQRANNAV